MVPVDSSCSLSKTEYKRHNHTWIVDNFRSRMSSSGCLAQTKVRTQNCSGWCLKLYHSNEHLSLEMRNIGGCHQIIHVHYIDENENWDFRFKTEFNSDTPRTYTLAAKPKFTGEDCIELVNGSLILGFKFFLVEQTTVQKHGDYTTEIPKSTIEADIRLLKDKHYLADLILSNGERDFKVHKAILCCRSPVLDRMFSNECLESKTNRLLIDDIDTDVLEELIVFIYGYETSFETLNLETLLNLLRAADKYQVMSLRQRCIKRIPRLLTVDTVSSVISMADIYQLSELKQKAMIFFKNNIEEVLRSSSWKELSAENLAVEVLLHYIESSSLYVKTEKQAIK